MSDLLWRFQVNAEKYGIANICRGCAGNTRRPLPVSNVPYPVVYCANEFHKTLPKAGYKETEP